MPTNKQFIFILAILCILICPCAAVKSADFKRCDQSGFCVRNRAFASMPQLSEYVIDQSTLKWNKEQGEIYAEMRNGKETGALFTVDINFYQDKIVRVRIDEKNGRRKRYRVPDVLINDANSLKKSQIDYKKVGEGLFMIDFGGEGNSAVLQLRPFSIDVINSGEPVASVNRKGWLNYEHYREKPENTTEFENNLLTKSSWEETFNGHLDSKRHGPSSVGVDVSFTGASEVFGIPEHATNYSLKSTKGAHKVYDEPYRLYNLDVFEFILDSPMALYGSVPFMLAHKIKGQKAYSTGMLWLNAAETWIDIQRETEVDHVSFQQQKDDTKDEATETTTTHWISESGIIDLFIFTGKDAKDVLNLYARVTGTQALPPIFALGYHQCRWNYMDEGEVRQVNEGFEKHDIPMDVIWLDIEHTNDKRYFTWQSSKFPDPKSMQLELAERYSRKMVTIIDPHIKRDDEYHVKKEGSARDLFVKNKDGSEFEGWCWPGSSSWLDFTNIKTRDFWSELFQFDRYEGSTKHLFTWNDMNEPSVFTGPEITMPKDNLHMDGWEHRDVHNLYGMYLHQATFMGHLRRDPNQRPFVLSRAFFSGSQRFGAVWTGDNMANWEHLESAVPMLLSLSTAGIHFCGVDVGGFFGNPEPELLTRWYQAGIFYPFFRGHAHLETKRREPWVFGEPYLSLIRQAIATRYQLLPFWYTLFKQSSLNGHPPMRPVFMEFPLVSQQLLLNKQQYMLGDSLLICPIVHSNTQNGGGQITFFTPGSELWFDYHTFSAFKPNFNIQLTDLTLHNQPIALLRAGKLIPLRLRLRRSSAAMANDPLTLLAALDSTGKSSGQVYLDDGNSFNYYKKNHFIHSLISVSLTPDLDLNVSISDIAQTTFEPWQEPFGVDKKSTKGESDNANIHSDIERLIILGIFLLMRLNKGSFKQLKSWVGEFKLDNDQVECTGTIIDVQGPANEKSVKIIIKKPKLSLSHSSKIYLLKRY